jgi:MFS family permease
VVPFVGFILSAALLCAGTFTANNWITVWLMASAIGCASLAEGPFWAMTISLAGDRVGAACSILNTGSNLAGFIAPVLTPFIASLASWAAGLYFACFVILLGAVACWFVQLEEPSVLQSDPGAE